MLTVRRALAWSISAQLGAQVIQLVSSICLARLLTPDEMGVFVLALSANLFLAALRDFGVANYLIRERDLTDDKIRTGYAAMILTSWAAALVLWLVSDHLARVYDAPGVSGVLTLIAASLVVVPIGQPAQALMQRDMRFDQINTVVLASALLTAIISVALALRGFSYLAPAWGLVAGTVLRAVLLIAYRPDHLRLWPALSHWRALLKFAGWTTGASVLGSLSAEGSKALLGVVLGPAASALFVRAQQLPYLARRSLFMSVNKVLMPDFSRKAREGTPLAPSVITLLTFTTALLWPMFLVTGLVSVSLIVAVFGNNWRIAGELLPWILGAQALAAALPQPEQILIPLGRVRLLFWVRLGGCVITLGFGIVGALQGLEMFVILRVFAAAVFFAALWRMFATIISLEPRALCTVYARSIAISAIAAAPAVLATQTIEGALNLAQLAIIAGASVVFWFLGLRAVRHPYLTEIARVFAHLRGATRATSEGPALERKTGQRP